MTTYKNTTQSAMCRSLKAVYFLIVFMIISSGCVDNNVNESGKSQTENISITSTNPIENIHKTLVGHNLTYYDIAGNQREYSISEKDIGIIEQTRYKGEDAWIVKVGRGMVWEIYLNATGDKMIEEIQLFKT